MTEIIITSSVLILTLILVRKLLWGKISRRLQYALWLLVVIRLLVPPQLLTSPLSIMNMVENMESSAITRIPEMYHENNTAGTDLPEANDDLTTDHYMQLDSDFSGQSDTSVQTNPSAAADRSSNTEKANSEAMVSAGKTSPSQPGLFKPLLLAIYLLGVCLTGGCILWCNVKFYKRLRRERTWMCKEGMLNVYAAKGVSSPCLFGFPAPSIYMTENAFCHEERKNHILLHEMTHYRHLDHIWAVVRSLCLALYWFHPLVWIAARFSMEDSELACDEGTFIKLGAENRESYGRTLIEMTAEQADHKGLLYCATGMTNGKKVLKERIKAIAAYKKQFLWITVTVLIFAAILAVVTAGAGSPDRQWWKKKDSVTFHTFVVNDITGKQYNDDYYLTIELDDSFAERYRLPSKEITLRTTQSVYDEIDVNELYIGISIESTHEYQRLQTIDELAMLLEQNDTDNMVVVSVSPGNNAEAEPAKPQLDAGIIRNEDGSFRLSQYSIDLTGDKIKDQIVFDVLYPADFGTDTGLITNEILWDELWTVGEISVKILEGSESSDARNDTAEASVLAEYSFSSMQETSNHLAIIRYEGQKCILRYGSKMDQGKGTFGYEILQLMPSGQESILLEEMTARYKQPAADVDAPDNNAPETIEQVAETAEKLDRYLFSSYTEILVNAYSDPNQCYLYGSEKGLTNGYRRQNALEVFLAAACGNGLELKVADYFYPHGKEPLTALPEDAEARVLNGEILYMLVSPENNTAGRLDLDGDGEKDVIYLEATGRNYYDNGWHSYGDDNYWLIDCGYRVRVNDQYYRVNYSNRTKPELMAFSPDGQQILLAVYDDGPSNDPTTAFYKYDDTGVHPAGMLYDNLQDASITEDGFIKCTFRADMLQTEWAWGYYYWNGSEIVRREDEIYYFIDDSKWREEVPLMLLKEISVYEERSENSKAITMKPQKVRNAASDQLEWIFLEAEDGSKGWFNIKQILPLERYELFDGLNMAD